MVEGNRETVWVVEIRKGSGIVLHPRSKVRSRSDVVESLVVVLGLLSEPMKSKPTLMSSLDGAVWKRGQCG